MYDNQPQGCLAAILRLIGIRLTGPSAVEQLPYRQRDDFLSASELSFYRVLATALDGSYTICPKVNLADIFYVARPNENLSYRNKINQKHVDFLLCDLTTMKPLVGVELDDSSHTRSDRQNRDQFVDGVFEVAGIPILHVTAANGYNPQQLVQLVCQAVTGRMVQENLAAEELSTPTCPKCGIGMVLRTAKKGVQQGESFWGCYNYPKCREMKSVR